MYTLVCGAIIAQHVDPVEKKPLFHFYPGSFAYSIATPSCNSRCQWCQNWDISQMPHQQGLDREVGRNVRPDRIVSAARVSGCRSIAYTYTEPTVFFEYARDTSRPAHEARLANIYVTYGFMTQGNLGAYHPRLDAANVGLKASRDETYRRYAGARCSRYWTA